MNMLEKRAFLKVPVNWGWAGGTGTPTKLGILLAPLRDGTLLGNRCLSTLSTALTHILSLFLAAVPVPERSPAGRPGGTLVSLCP